MSFCAGFTIKDGVILICDGMVATFTPDENGPQEIDDEVDKLEKVSDSIFAVRFGIEEISGEIIEKLRWIDYPTPQAVYDRLVNVTDEAWSEAGSFFAGHLADLDSMGVGVLVGGIVEGVPFIASALRHPTGTAPDMLCTEPWATWQVGLQTDEECERFNKEAAEQMQTYRSEPT